MKGYFLTVNLNFSEHNYGGIAQCCTWIYQSLLKQLFELLALDVSSLGQVSVHLVADDHNTPWLVPLLEGIPSLLWPLYCGQLNHLWNIPKINMSISQESFMSGMWWGAVKHEQLKRLKKQFITSKLSSSFIPCCHFSNSLSQLRTVFRGQTTRALVKSSFSQSSKVWRNVTTYRANREIQLHSCGVTAQFCNKEFVKLNPAVSKKLYSYSSNRQLRRFVTC